MVDILITVFTNKHIGHVRYFSSFRFPNMGSLA